MGFKGPCKLSIERAAVGPGILRGGALQELRTRRMSGDLFSTNATASPRASNGQYYPSDFMI